MIEPASDQRPLVGWPPMVSVLRSALARQGRAQGWATELLISASAISTAVLARIAIEQVVGGVVPFVLTFPVVIGATLLAGARAGVVTAVGCQVLTILFVFPNWTAEHGGQPTDIANLILSTASLAVMIWGTASYRQISGQLRDHCEREVGTLSLLIGEMDHRTKNNFQIAAAMLAAQARAAGNEDVARELDRASARLASIASVYRNLSAVKDKSGKIYLGDHLGEIATLLRQGVVPPAVALSLRCESVRVPAQTAMMIGLIVNEWISNAVKYAFADKPGLITVEARADGGALLVTVADTGAGASKTPVASLGSRLINGLAKAIDATAEVEYGQGTRCSLRMPLR